MNNSSTEIIKTQHNLAHAQPQKSSGALRLAPLNSVGEESALMSAFRRSDDRGRESILAFAESMAEDWPTERTPGSIPDDATVGAVEIQRLAAVADDLSRQLASLAQASLPDRLDLLLDCSSLADDFARDLDTLAGARYGE